MTKPMVCFYEKPGCVGNQRQKVILRRAKINFIAKNILSQNWTKESLLPYFSGMPVNEWFNQNAPQVKTGELDIFNVSESKALDLMMDEPLLIRRPLLHYQGLKQAGFDDGVVMNALGLVGAKTLEACATAA